MKRALRDRIREAEAAGLKVLGWTGGKHLALSVRAEDGREGTIWVSHSPIDRNRNWQADFKRFAKGKGPA